MMKRQASKREKRYAIHISNKRLVSRICIDFSKVNRNQTIQFEKWEKSHERTFHQRGYTDGI